MSSPAAPTTIQPDASGHGMRVITLGTAAGPAIRSNRPGIATAIEVDGVHYLVDFGLGVTRAAHAAGLRGQNLRAAFITHLHSDHVAELPPYLLWNWGQPVQGFTTPIDVIGPDGTRAMVTHALNAFAYDIDIRVVDEGRPDLREIVHTRDIELPAAVAHADGHHTPAMQPFEVYRDDLITVTAILVAHPPVFPALAFRIDSAYGSVVLSGDTAECDNLVTLARGADLLIHEAVNLAYYEANDFAPEFVNHQAKSHTTPTGAGRIAGRAGVPHLILSHLAGVATDAEWAEQAAREYAGTVTVAQPGQVFSLQRVAVSA